MKSIRRHGLALLWALAVLLGGGSGHAFACAICLSAVSVTTGQRLDAADQIVLAVPTDDGQRFRAVEIVKGDVLPGAIVEASADATEPGDPRGGKPHLLARNGLSGRWTSYGVIGPGHAGWLREFVKTNDGPSKRPPRAWPLTSAVQAAADTTNWSKRIFLIAPYLESEDPLAAEIAFGELSRAPYEAMRLLRPALDADRVRGWIEDPALFPRHDAYLLLLGIAGNTDDATKLERRLAGARASQDATYLAAMLAADLELNGPSRVAWVEENYLADRSRSVPEIEAALLALSVHGGAVGAISRQRIVDAYRRFIRERQPMAGFVAPYLSEWRAWDAVPDYVEVLRSNAVKDPAGQFAILVYLRDSPDTVARSAAEAFTAHAN